MFYMEDSRFNSLDFKDIHDIIIIIYLSFNIVFLIILRTYFLKLYVAAALLLHCSVHCRNKISTKRHKVKNPVLPLSLDNDG